MKNLKIMLKNSQQLREYSKLVYKNFNIHLSDSSIYNIFKKYKLTRKRLRSKYYPEKRRGQEKQDLDNFYKNLEKYNYKKTICLDETSIYLNMTLSYGNSKSGKRVIKKQQNILIKDIIYYVQYVQIK